jgi:hypothetical protein
MDSDDMILDKDVFSILLNIISKGNFDIIIYNSISTNLKPDVYTTKIAPTDFDNNHKPNRILFQPDLGYYHITPSKNHEQFQFNDELIHGKLFKAIIYKIAINNLGKERYSRYMISGEDDLINNIIFNTAKSAKFISKYGYLYINNEESFSKQQKDKVQIVRNLLYILDSLIDFTLNIPRNKRILVNFILYLYKQKYLNAEQIRGKKKCLVSDHMVHWTRSPYRPLKTVYKTCCKGIRLVKGQMRGVGYQL